MKQPGGFSPFSPAGSRREPGQVVQGTSAILWRLERRPDVLAAVSRQCSVKRCERREAGAALGAIMVVGHRGASESVPLTRPAASLASRSGATDRVVQRMVSAYLNHSQPHLD